MIQVLVNGCNGKMGRIVTKLLEENDDFCVFGGFDRMVSDEYEYRTFTQLSEIVDKPDVIIDFSIPEATFSILTYAISKKVPIVIATTGFTEKQEKQIEEYAKQIPIFKASNMSFDIHLMGKLVSQIASILNHTDIEIIETHHNRKIDSPSGTALYLADQIKQARKEKNKQELTYNLTRIQQKEKRNPNEIGFSSIRGGNIVGEHTVKFFGPNETLEITHTSYSREVFAEGALQAAKFIVTKQPGIYTMNNMTQ